MKFTKMVMMLTLTTLAVQTNFCMDASVEQVEQDTKGFLADLRAYKKCRKSEQGCPQELMSRLKTRAAYIGLGAAALAAGTGLAIAGVVYAKRRRGGVQRVKNPELYEEALQHIKLTSADLNDAEQSLLQDAVNQDNPPASASEYFRKIKEQNESKIIKALNFINTTNRNEQWRYFITELDQLVLRAKKSLY